MLENLALTLTYVVLPLSAVGILRLTPHCAKRDRFPLYVVSAALVGMAMLCAAYL
jgi:hypothetical protein